MTGPVAIREEVKVAWRVEFPAWVRGALLAGERTVVEERVVVLAAVGAAETAEVTQHCRSCKPLTCRASLRP